jgi:hypothetical protein
LHSADGEGTVSSYRPGQHCKDENGQNGGYEQGTLFHDETSICEIITVIRILFQAWDSLGIAPRFSNLIPMFLC